MTTDRDTLLGWIDQDREHLVSFLSRFLQARSPNPPGDTREAAALVCEFLSRQETSPTVIAPQPEMPNIVATFDGGHAGKHLVLNGHMDVYPVGDEPWTHDPWGGKIVGGRLYGRGACDMKAGTAASVVAFAYLHRIRHELTGRLTLTAVSDEETMGPWGARYLMEHHPAVHGDCLLNGEPSSPYSVRVGEKGLLWLRFTVTTPGAHGAYTHMSKSATKIAAQLVSELESVTSIEPSPPPTVARFLKGIEEAMEKAQGPGAYETVQRVTLNVGVLRGGLKVNMTPGQCCIEADIRLPLGTTKERVMIEVERLLGAYPEVELEEIEYMPPSFCSPKGEMVGILRKNVRELLGFDPTPILSIGGTDARLWRYRGIPAYVYGVSPTGMASSDEHVQIDEWLHIVRTHLLSAYDYLGGG